MHVMFPKVKNAEVSDTTGDAQRYEAGKKSCLLMEAAFAINYIALRKQFIFSST